MYCNYKSEIKDFTGISAPFEKPINADLVLNTNTLSVAQSVEKVLDKIKNKITYKWDHITLPI